MKIPSLTAIVALLSVLAGAISVLAEPLQNPDETVLAKPGESPAAALAAFELPWHSLNGGGALGAASANYELNNSLGQSVTGKSASASFAMGIGFWYGVPSGGGCPIALTGDVNESGAITSADIIVEVNFCFKGGPDPLPCVASGDVNCSGAVTSADIIFLVNFVFKTGPGPCDGCTSPLAAGC